MSDVAVLGPQRFDPTITSALTSLGVQGPVCVVTAGWQEREGELRDLQEHLDCQIVDLELYHRAEDVFARDVELFEAQHERQSLLKEMQRLYRFRLAREAEVVIELYRMQGDLVLLDRERRSALAAARTLDRQHLKRIERVHQDFQTSWRPAERASVQAHRGELARIVAHCHAVLIAGGHVARLANRLRLFGMGSLMRALPIVAWSAGAMVLCERIVLFHDFPPQGFGAAEILEAGLGIVPGAVLLPHASKRLALDDALRVGVFARRFAPAHCLALEPETVLRWHDGALVTATAARRLTGSGRLVKVRGR